jgi:hypothetical protein
MTTIPNIDNSLTQLEDIAPDILFSPSYQQQHREIFKEYFHKNYILVDKVNELTYSTNHVTYSIYYNEKQKDVRLYRSMNGCFSSQHAFVSIDSIEHQIAELKKTIQQQVQPKTIEWFANQLPPLEKIVSLYNNPTNTESNQKLKIK